MTKTLERPELDVLDEYQGKWANLYFMCDGKTYLGHILFDSAAEAKEYADERDRIDPPNYYLSDEDHQKLGVPICTYRVRDISRKTQIPVTS